MMVDRNPFAVLDFDIEEFTGHTETNIPEKPKITYELKKEPEIVANPEHKIEIKKEIKREFKSKLKDMSPKNNEFDNKKILSTIASLRVERANLLGYKSHADYVLEKNMAKNPETVYKFLNDLWNPALKRAKMEINDMQKIIDNEGNNFKL